ncbi:DUF975 family protein [Coraliomargarita parva]|uniref:DUF975 family protein n=1 Tax=Coraliomargarita parva TaxID=3014050 RepID=UPI0022B55FCA|nr:DUF975 family protein [Coraliomargarita parva]
MEWYYERNGEQNGPVSEAELKGLLATSMIKEQNLIWREGMQDWASFGSIFGAGEAEAPAKLGLATAACPTCGSQVRANELIPAGDSQICPNCRDEYAQGLREGLSRPVVGGRIRGTGGMTPNSELRGQARDALSGNWGNAVLVVFIYGVIQQACGMIPLAGMLLQWLLTGPMMLGMVAFFMGLNRAESAEVGTLFSGFSRFFAGFGIYFVTSILMSLAGLLAAAPGIVLVVMAYTGGAPIPEEDPMFVAGLFVALIPGAIVWTYMFLRYGVVYYIANDEPELGVLGAIKRSTEVMKGRKAKLFGLYLSFIGWMFLGMLAFLIGMLWSTAYMSAAIAAFYDDLSEDA